MSNTANINKLIELLRADQGRHFIMRKFVHHLGTDDNCRIQQYAECKTACCLAGWANTFALAEEEGTDWKSITGYNFAAELGDRERAGHWLGITDYCTYIELFEIHSLQDIGVMPLTKFDNLPAETRVSAAIAVLEHLRDTGYVNWLRALNSVGWRPDYRPWTQEELSDGA